MANTNVFPLSETLDNIQRGAQFVDFAGLDYFWGLAKNYVDTADAALAGRAAALEATVNGTETTEGLVKKVADLRSEVDALGGAEGGIQGMIDASIADLDVEDAAVDGQYVSSVSEVDGKISVSRVALPDWTDAINGAAADALQDAKDYVTEQDFPGKIATAKGEAVTSAAEYTDAREVVINGKIDGVAGDLADHIADAVSHITADERAAWNAAKSDIDAFLANAGFDEEGKNVVDTLKELQDYLKSDETAAGELVNRVAALEGADVTINGRIDGVASDLSTLSGTVTTLSGTVADNKAAIEKTVADNKAAIEKTVADLDAAYKQADSDLNGRVDTVAGDLSTLSGTVADNKAAIEKTVADLEVALKKYADDAEAQALADAKSHVAEVIANYYTKTEVDSALTLKADLSYVNDELAKKADKSTTYTKTEVDDLLSGNSSADQAYAKEYTDALFNSISFVSKDQIDGLFA